MSIEETIHKLMQLKLPMMAQVLRESLTTPAGEALTVEERIAMMVDREWIERENRRTARRVKDAKLGMHARVEDLWCDPARGRDKAVLRALTTCQWVRSKQNVIITGLTGTGKSYLAAALAEAACRRGYRALRARVPRLLAELAVAHADGSFPALLQRLAKLDVLVLDDFLIAPLKDSERRDLLEVLEDRYDRTSTIITSQLPTKTWHEMLADPTLADAICDRMVHNAHVLSLTGPSIRKKKGLEGKIADERTMEEKG
jgi:DNA replication protein DnaC